MSNENIVAKSNRLIEASYRLSLVEQQMILFAICRAREEQKGLSSTTWLTLDSKAFAAAFGTDPRNAYRQLAEAAATLYDRSITMYDDIGDPRRIETRWIQAKAKIDNRGHVQLKFADDVIPYLERIETEFTSYRLEKIGKLSSAYAVRMYELLVQYANTKQKSRVFAIVDLKRTLGLGELEYPRILDFKKWVIDVAVAQINAHTDITTSYTQQRTGRTITHLTFAIKLKAAPKPKKPKVDRAYVEQHARVGESYDEAFARLKKTAA
jgi:plasmid replication initiation protein